MCVPEINDTLQAKNIKNVILVGIEAHVCILIFFLSLSLNYYHLIIIIIYICLLNIFYHFKFGKDFFLYK